VLKYLTSQQQQEQQEEYFKKEQQEKIFSPKLFFGAVLPERPMSTLST
jgi:hypothetical protein